MVKQQHIKSYPMKKIIILLLLLIAFKAEAQKSVTFKFKYLPDHNYTGGLNMTINGNVTLKGDTQMINRLKAQGISQPMALNVAMKMDGDTKTGSPDANGIFPLVMSYKMDTLNVNVGGKAVPIPSKINSGINIYGRVSADGKLTADSIGGGKMKDTSHQKMSQMMNSFQNMIKFPNRPLSVGYEFTQDIPFFPIADSPGKKAKAKITYKVDAIVGDHAFFSVDEVVSLHVGFKQMILDLEGTGTGAMIYSIKNNLPMSFHYILNLKVGGKSTSLANGSLIMKMNYWYDID
jgi:hypothetical protein